MERPGATPDDQLEPRGAAVLEPLPYQRAMADHLQASAPELWEWFASNRVRRENVEAVRLDLLKHTYRLEVERHGELQEHARAACAALGLDVPVTFYQAQQSSSSANAGVAFVPGEVHIVLEGPVLRDLAGAELRSIIGHECAHVRLWEGWDNRYLLTEQILSALALDPEVHDAHVHSARHYGLFTEVFCDRGALLAGGRDLEGAVAALVKLQTGLAEVDAASYLRQAREILDAGPARAEGVTHPESYLRARALELWAIGADGAEAAIDRMIRGPLGLDTLDLLDQQGVSDLTRRVIDALLAPAWFRTETVLAHARLFFDDYEAPGPAGAVAVPEGADDSLADYLSYVLMDFATVDRDLEEAPMVAGLRLAEHLGFGARYAEVLAGEAGLRKGQLEKLRAAGDDILARAERAGVEP